MDGGGKGCCGSFKEKAHILSRPFAPRPFAPHGHLPSSEEVDGLVKQARAAPGGAFPTSGKKFIPPIRLSSTSFMPMKIWGKGQKFQNQ